MALRTILTDNDPALHKVCRPVTNFDGRLHDLIDDLKETLAEANGAGLAAPQVGILRRVVIVVDNEENMLELVNPELIAQEGEQEGFEAVSYTHLTGSCGILWWTVRFGSGWGPGFFAGCSGKVIAGQRPSGQTCLLYTSRCV